MRDSEASTEGRATGASHAAAPPHELSAGSVSLQAFRGTEGPELTRLVTRNLEHLRPWMPWAREVPTEEANVEYVHRAVEEWERGIGFGYWLREVATGEMVGCAGMHNRLGPCAIEIGYWVSVDRVRRGYATGAARALTAAAFGISGIQQVEIHCDEANVASAAIPKRLGYRLERIEPVAPHTPSRSGRTMVWVVDAVAWVRAAS